MRTIYYDVFLSRKSDDAPLAKEIYDFLTGKGLKVFDSDHSLGESGNTDYATAIDTAIENSMHLVVIGSSIENIRAPWVEHEWRLFMNLKFARKNKGNLLTLISGNTKPSELPHSLAYYQVIQFDKYKVQLLNYVMTFAEPPERQMARTSAPRDIEMPPISAPRQLRIPAKVWYVSIAVITVLMTTVLIWYNFDSNKNSTEDSLNAGLSDIDSLSKDKEKHIAIADSSRPDKTIKTALSTKKTPVFVTQITDYAYDTLSPTELEPIAAKGITKAQFILGEKNFNAGKYHDAYKWLLPAAEKKNDVAQWRLGIMYEYGDKSNFRFPVAQDYTQAFKWYLKSAELGNKDSQYSLGLFYLNGYSVLKDKEKAKYWFEGSAKLGNKAAQEILEKEYH